MTRDIVWSPSRYDSSPSSNDTWFKESANPPPLHSDFDFFGEHDDDVAFLLYYLIISIIVINIDFVVKLSVPVWYTTKSFF